MKTRIAVDRNGNKVVRIKIGKRTTSIQTNGNLPNTHQTNVVDTIELKQYVGIWGTNHQKKMFGFDSE